MNIPRLRVIAGPNGSGKSTLAKQLSSKYAVNLYHFLNSDILNAEIRKTHKTACPFSIDPQALVDFVNHSTYPEEYKYPFQNQKIQIHNDDYVYCNADSINSYTSAILADFFKEQFLLRKISFSFETVFSHPAKIEMIRMAQLQGYRTYLYFVATESPEININRIEIRAAQGGHAVPEDKTRSRYIRCLNQVKPVIPYLDRAFFFDNTFASTRFIAEYSKESNLTFYVNPLPHWFKKYAL